MVYADYISHCPEGYKHSAFPVRLNAYMGMSRPSMRVPHKVGDKLFIDFTGKKLQVVDILSKGQKGELDFLSQTEVML